MDFNVATNRVVLNAAEAKRLVEARDLLRHIHRLAGESPLVGSNGAGDWAKESAGGINNVLERVDWVRPKETNVASTKEPAKEDKEPLGDQGKSAEPLVK